MTEDPAQWFIGKYPPDLTPRHGDGAVDFECLCGEFLAEGTPMEEVRKRYDALPPELKRPKHD